MGKKYMNWNCNSLLNYFALFCSLLLRIHDDETRPPCYKLEESFPVFKYLLSTRKKINWFLIPEREFPHFDLIVSSQPRSSACHGLEEIWKLLMEIIFHLELNKKKREQWQLLAMFHAFGWRLVIQFIENVIKCLTQSLHHIEIHK